MKTKKTRLIYGKGYYDGSIVDTTAENRRYYNCWYNMLKRCYSKPSDDTVCDLWLSFEHFVNWMSEQDHEGKFLTKDLIKPGCTVYAPHTCYFVSKSIASLINPGSSTTNDLPPGVSFMRQRRKYRAQCRFNGEQLHVGLFDTPREAGRAYDSYRASLLRELAQSETKLSARALLVAYADNLDPPEIYNFLNTA